MIIFGWGKRKARQVGQSGPYRCRNCSNVSVWALSIVTTWFSLFFIPVIPYKRDYMMTCRVCRGGTRLTKTQFEESLRRSKQKEAIFAERIR